MAIDDLAGGCPPVELKSLLAGRILWRATEEIERRSSLWFNRPIRIAGTWRRAFVAEVNERIAEIPFAHARVQGRKVLVVGSCESVLPLELASLGFEVVALDLREYPLAHPRLTCVKADIRRTGLPGDTFDTVVAVSTLEHIGLGFYGDPVDSDGDRNAAVEIGRILKRGGRFLLTVPFGRAATVPGHRVYDAGRLGALVAGFEVEELLCCVREGPTSWRPAGAEEAERVDSSSVVRGVALLSLRKPVHAS